MSVHPRLHASLPALGTGLAYWLAGQLALLLAIPPGYATPLYPAAGIALAATLAFGARALPGVLLGAFAVNFALASARGTHDWRMVAVPLAIAGGAMLQAALGAWWVRATVRLPLVFSEPRDVLRLAVLGGLLASLVNAAVATVALGSAGIVPPGELLFTAWTWWAGDALGVLIGAPITLTLVGRPREAWRARRWTVGLPLLAMTLLLAVATQLVARWDAQRSQATFEREALAASTSLQNTLREPLQALVAQRGVFLASDDVTRDEMRVASEPWLQAPGTLQALGYSERVPRAELPRFEAAQRASGAPGYRVFDRPEGAAAAQGDGHVMALRYIEPRDMNAAALGVNALSVPAARQAIERAIATDMPVASAGFHLTQEQGDQTGVVVYRALYRRGALETPAPDERAQRATGVVFATLRMSTTAEAALARAPGYLQWCLLDIDPTAARPRLAGRPGCEQAMPAGVYHHEHALDFAGRRWSLRVWAAPASLPDARSWNAWLFSLVGLASAAILGALLLTVTGRARRIEQAVQERTVELQTEVLERHRTGSALRDSEQRLRNILDHVPMGVVYANLAGVIRESNPSLRELVGYSAEELLQRSIADLTHPDDRADSAALIQPLVRGELPVARGEKRLVHRNGEPVWTRMELSVLRDAEGRPQRLVGVFENISERLRLRDAERARDSAEAANRAKSEFVSRMSHELRTPLNAMLGFAQLLELDRQPELAAHQHQWATQIQQAGWHLLHMINDTLDLSRIESGNVKLELQTLDLATLVRATMAMMETAARRRGIHIDESVSPAASLVRGDNTRVKQIVTNLLSNAIKYNVDEGVVHVTSWAVGDDQVVLAVQDSGLGMSEAQLAELFQPFNRLGREHSGTEGTGIGLVISRRLAELMGGRLEVQSAPDQGSTFLLTLPRALPGQASPGLASAQAELADGYRRRIVHYVEDNETNAEVMRGILARRPQVDLQVSTNGLDGLAAIRVQPPSLILLDMHLPDLDGLELLRHLKADPNTAAIPVVGVSADATQARIEQAFAQGATDYVTKPVNVAAFLALIDRLLGEQDTVFG